MNDAKTYDVIVLGGGRGGMNLVVQLAAAGKKVLLVEKDRAMIGGSCINIACIPTKAFIACARRLAQCKGAKAFGINSEGNKADWLAIRRRVEDITSSFRSSNQSLVDQKENIHFVVGFGRFCGDKTIEIETENKKFIKATAADIVVNTGTRPSIPNLPGFKEYCLTSETIQKIDRLPEHLVVVGAGFIGLELAQLFSMLGSKVTLVNADARLLPNEDEQVANILCKAFAAAGITVLNNAKAKEVTQDHKVLLEDGAEVQGTAVLLAIGRKPNTESIDTQKSAIDLCPKGFVKVDERLISSNPGVYAIGDVNGGPQFTSVSYDDHKVVFNQLIGKRSKTTKSRLVPFTLFTSPEVARVGLTEAQAKDLSMEYESLEMPLDGLPSGLIHDYGAGLLKVLICKKSKKLIGCSLVTAEAAHMIGIAQTAIVAGLPFNALRDLILTHPTISEAFNFLLAQSSLEDQSFEDVAVTWRIKLRGLANCFANPEP